MKRYFSLTLIAAALVLASSLPAKAQSDPRTRKIIEAVLQTTAKEIGSETADVPETPVKAKSYTTTEKPREAPREKPAPAPSGSGAQRKAPSASAGRGQAPAPSPAAPQERAPSREPAPAPQRHAELPAINIDTIYLSTLFTTHLIFDTDISYADLSNQTDIAGKIVEEARNKLALKARNPFTTTASVSVEEGGGQFHTYILKYREAPRLLIVDTREGADLRALSRLDTVYISTLYTTHLIFTADVVYADLSRPADMTGRLVDQGRNKLAIKARAPFAGLGSLSVEEGNGVFHTYVVKYMEQPLALVKDTRDEGKPLAGSIGGSTSRGTTTGSYLRNSASKSADGTSGGVAANRMKKLDAPMLSEVIGMPQGLFHISAKKYDIRFTCENIFSYSDMIYMTFRLDNGSGISYEVSDATFVMESSNGSKRKIVYEENIFAKNRFGSLTAGPNGTSKICYSFDKMALSSDQILKVYLYEKDGQRNLTLPISYKDMNGAIAPIEGKLKE